MEIRGIIIKNDTYAEAARVCLKKESLGTDHIIIEDGVMYLYRSGSLIRISKVFDIDFR